MGRKKDTGISYKAFAVCIFLFLNLLLVASPVIHAASANTVFVSSGGPISQNHSDQEENNLLKHLPGNKHEYHSSRGKQRVAAISSQKAQQITSSAPSADESGFKYTDSNFIVRPAYYCLLFLHQLF